jgi:hypothetical protein
MNLPIVGLVVTRCLVDAAFSIQFYTPNYEATLRIEALFVLRSNSHTDLLDPARPSELCPALSLVSAKVTVCQIDQTGRLQMKTYSDSGLTVEVSPSGEYEAWGFSDSAGRGVVSLPSGGIDRWGPDLESPST